MPTIGDFTAPGSSVGGTSIAGAAGAAGATGAAGAATKCVTDAAFRSLTTRTRRPPCSTSTSLRSCSSGDLGERRDDRKIQGAGPGRRRSDANRLFQQVSRILVEKRVRSYSPAVGLNKGQQWVSRAYTHRRFRVVRGQVADIEPRDRFRGEMFRGNRLRNDAEFRLRNGNFACEAENFACEAENFACEGKRFVPRPASP